MNNFKHIVFMKHLFKSVLLVLLVYASAGCFSAHALENIKVGNTTRTMISYAPEGLPSQPALVIVCHGANQDAAYQQGMSKWESVADTAKFVVVYANGVNRFWDISGQSDLNFMTAIIDTMYQRHRINRNRVYLTGFSMGGMFTYFCATRLADRIAAFAPVSGYLMSGPNATSTRPVPILHTHGTADDVCTYAPVQNHIDAWVKFNGCSPTPEVIKPYPSSKPYSPASMKKYTGGRNGVEVWLLTLADKGHWWSMDASQAVTSEEIWNFCKRYSLGEEEPEVKAIVPEDRSFDLLSMRDRSFVVTFSDSINSEKVKAVLSSADASIELQVEEAGFEPQLTFSLPADATVADGVWKLTISNAETRKGGVMRAQTFNYVYGVEEVGETLRVDTLYHPNWSAERESIGEGIPMGWKRTNTTSAGTTETTNEGTANCPGVRMKYFLPGGDFDAGFYFSARDNNLCNIRYGAYAASRLHLPAGNYTLSFRSTYWSEGALAANATYSCNLADFSKNVIWAAASIPSSGTMSEDTNQQILGSRLHRYDIKVNTTDNYILNYEMNEGWNSVILGDILLTTQPSLADLYKGTFLRTLQSARNALAGYENCDAGQALQQVIEQLADFVSTSPIAYTAATRELEQALATFDAAEKVLSDIHIVRDPASSSVSDWQESRDLLGRRLPSSARGLCVQGQKIVFVK